MIKDTDKISVEVLRNSIHPTLLFSFKLSIRKDFELPIFGGGYLETSDRKRIAEVTSAGDNQMMLPLSLGNKLNHHEVVQISNEKHEIIFKVICQLDEFALSFLEKERHRNSKMEMHLFLTVQFLVLNSDIFFMRNFDDSNCKRIPAIESQLYPVSYQLVIPESRWIQEFAEPLGIGKFLLLELRLYENKSEDKIWAEAIKRSYNHVETMEKLIKQANWHGAIEKARRIAENFQFKYSEGVLVEQPNGKAELKKLFAQSHASDEAFDSFYATIKGIFEFASKFIHDKNKKGEYFTPPKPQEEDAYFVFATCVSLVNLISAKIK